MTTKPFDPTKPVQTRDGRKARILGPIKSVWGTYVAVAEKGSQEEFYGVYDNGRYFTKEGSDHHNDLINVPQKRWVNIYRTPQGMPCCGKPFHHRETANLESGSQRIDCVEIDWPE